MAKRFTVILMVLMVFSQYSIADEFDFTLNGNGARAAAMGYAFTGLADDATAISWNPAGLTQLYQMEASVIGRLGFGSASYEGFDSGIIDSWEADVSSSFQLNFASFVVPFSVSNLNVAGGIAYRRVYDFTSEITQTVMGPGLLGDVEIYDNVEGGINSIAPSIGVQLNEMFSVGATVNILSGTEDGNGELSVDGVVDPSFDYDYSIDYSGVAIDLGVLIKATDQFSLGATFNLPHTRTVDYGSGFEIEADAPLFWTAGAAFRATDQLLLAFDYRSRPFSKIEGRGLFEGETILEYDLSDSEDMNSIHVGLEFLMEAGNNFVPLRLGFYTDPSPHVDNNNDQIVTNVFTAGLGIIMDKLIIDGAFEWAMTSYEDVDPFTGNPVDFSGNGFRFTFGGTLHLGGN